MNILKLFFSGKVRQNKGDHSLLEGCRRLPPAPKNRRSAPDNACDICLYVYLWFFVVRPASVKAWVLRMILTWTTLTHWSSDPEMTLRWTLTSRCYSLVCVLQSCSSNRNAWFYNSSRHALASRILNGFLFVHLTGWLIPVTCAETLNSFKQKWIEM